MGFLAGALGMNSGYQADTGGAMGTALLNESTQALQRQRNLINQLNAQNPIQNQQSVFDQQQGLANQLQNQSMGLGPNPAQAQLAQATAANTANQAALMAGQRGASSNAGLIARQAAQQGGANQQAMAGQAATLGAQQQLAAQQQLQNQQANMAGLATNQVGQVANLTQGLNAATQGLYSGFNSNVNAQNQINSQVAAQNQATQNQMTMGGLKAIGSAVAGIPMGGGSSPQVMAGGPTPMSQTGQMMAAGGGQVPGPSSMLGQTLKGMNMKSGGPVPGTPKVGGAVNSYANDTVPAKLSPGEIVLPRTVTQSANPAKNAEAFVRAIMAKSGRK